ncbi:kelch-like [Desmophyllum pertusum]|uniref:Kelch-like n=1 Tax=Desmophyllum pertusum TaxID=174260 RepID=A0A9X0CQL2_9CNID|nr:kelch-like [Desmophyllum pertusum]
MTDTLVKRNEGNLNMVKKALKRIGPWQPRQSGQVIVTSAGNETFCYLPYEAAWYRLAPSRYEFKDARQLVSFQGKIYNFNLKLFSSGVACYDPVSESWAKLGFPKNLIPNMVTVLGDSIYGVGFRQSSLLVSKCNLGSKTWDRIPLSYGYINEGACMVGHDNWLYFIGGIQVSQPASASSVVKGFNVLEIKWKRLANMQQERYSAFGAAGPGKIYIAGGKQSADEPLQSCEVYDIATNVWQSIASLNGPRSDASMVCYPLGALYVLGGVSKEGLPRALTVECYDPATNTWEDIATIPHIVADNPGTSHAENRVMIRQGFQIDCARSGKGLSGSDDPDSCIFQACLLNLPKGVLASRLEEGSGLHSGMSLLMPKPIN